MAFNALQSIQKRHVPSSFLTKIIDEEKGLVLGAMIPSCIIS